MLATPLIDYVGVDVRGQEAGDIGHLPGRICWRGGKRPGGWRCWPPHLVEYVGGEVRGQEAGDAGQAREAVDHIRQIARPQHNQPVI